MLQGYFYTCGSEDRGGLLDGHKQFKSLRREPCPVKPTEADSQKEHGCLSRSTLEPAI
jgi:hypothetical protein